MTSSLPSHSFIVFHRFSVGLNRVLSLDIYNRKENMTNAYIISPPLSYILYPILEYYFQLEGISKVSLTLFLSPIPVSPFSPPSGGVFSSLLTTRFNISKLLNSRYRVPPKEWHTLKGHSDQYQYLPSNINHYFVVTLYSSSIAVSSIEAYELSQK